MELKRAAGRELSLVAAGLFCYVAVSNVVYSLLSRILGDLLLQPLMAVSADSFCFLLGMTASVLVLNKKGEEWPYRRITGNERLASLFAIPALLLPVQYLSSTIDTVLRGIGIKSFEGSSVVPEGPVGLLLFFIQAVVLPVFFEELIFRGLILQRLRPYGDIFAAVASSLFFALMHNTLYALPAIFLLGVIFSLADIAAGSLLPSMMMHAVNNTITVLSWIFSENGQLTQRFSASLGYLMIFSAIVLPFLLLSLRRIRGRVFPVEKGGLSPARIFFNIPSVGFMAFMLYLIISVSEVSV